MWYILLSETFNALHQPTYWRRPKLFITVTTQSQIELENHEWILQSLFKLSIPYCKGRRKKGICKLNFTFQNQNLFYAKSPNSGKYEYYLITFTKKQVQGIAYMIVCTKFEGNRSKIVTCRAGGQDRCSIHVSGFQSHYDGHLNCKIFRWIFR